VAEQFTFSHRLRVRYNECDPQNVVFNANYFTYFDIAITELWREAFGSYDSMLELGADLMVAEASARYRAPARFDDELEVALRIERLGQSSMTTQLSVTRGGALVTEGGMRHVCIDPRTQEKQPIPEPIRRTLERYLSS
jgi:acyl-CoA thioester hydrolase